VAVQELSLEACVHGLIREPWRWHAALASTRRQPHGATDAMWQHGSRMELHLLAPYAGEERQLDKATEALEQFGQLIAPGDDVPSDSTRRQLTRYVDWWTNDNGFFPGQSDLSADARELLAGWD
jgi:hypothetical protein